MPGENDMLKGWGRRSSFNVRKHVMIPFEELRGRLDYQTSAIPGEERVFARLEP